VNTPAGTIRIFYSWQSDRSSDCCRRFVEIALQSVIATLQPDCAEQLVLDSDTAGVAGTPPVTETILEKIRTCDIFVADVTFVGETVANKLLPNPNVMTEFGYARAHLNHRQIILVMNRAFGPPESLPFDMAHLRHPLDWSLKEGAAPADRRQARAKFSEKMAFALNASIEFVRANRTVTAVPPPRYNEALELVSSLDMGRGMSSLPAIVNGPKLVVRMASLASLDEPRIDPALVKEARLLFTPDGYANRIDQASAGQWSSHDPGRKRGDFQNPESRWYSRLILPGIFETSVLIGARIDDDRTILVEGRPLEGRIVEVVRRSAALFEEIGMGGSAVLTVALLQLEDVDVTMSRFIGRLRDLPGIHLGSARIPAVEELKPIALQPMLDRMWLAFGFEDGATSFGDGAWDGDVDPERFQSAVVDGRAWR
jgi:hypothetical protein